MVVRKAFNCRWLLLLILFFQAFICRAQLAAKFSATPVSGCEPLLVNFSDQSSGNPTSWKWDLGNGTISFLQNPAVTYFAPGQYNIKLIVKTANKTDSVIKNQYITVQAIPNVSFAATPLQGCFPLPVQFTDKSAAGSGSISLREWDFGDGNISSLQNPSHTYTGTGNFNVTLRESNSFGCVKTVTKTQYIKIGSGVHANFTNSVPNSCKSPVTINFTNTSTGVGALTYQWLFGDGGTSALANPSHTYSSNGSYAVQLIVTNATGCTDTITKQNAITLGNVNADFSIPSVVCVGTSITLTNTSVPSPANVLWNFGDGTTSNILNPSKTYNAQGNFIIKMNADFGTCSDSVSKTVSVLPKPSVNFLADRAASCRQPFTVNFTGIVTGAISYTWDFGDGTTSSSQNPSHTYLSTGSFDVKLVAINASGCKDSLVKPAYIKIQPPTVSIPNLPIKDCAPLTFNFTANVNSVDSVVSYQWDFGDGSTSTLSNPAHTFINPGSYTIRVIVTTAGGCTDTATFVDGVLAGSKPKVNFIATPRNVCAFLAVNFTDLTTGPANKWLWLFGDGSSSSQQNPKHAYQDTGYFDITLIVWDNGCPDTLKFSQYIHISPPIAVFTVDNDCGSSRTKTFSDHSIGADTWQWTFGDGGSSSQQNPVHNYADTGSYAVTLTVTNFVTGCSHTTTATILILNERADFTASDTVICKGSTIDFAARNIKAANISSYYWDFGDGSQTTSASDSVKHTYLKEGKYTVKLVITNILSCKDSLRKDLYINVNGPTASFKSSAAGICLNTPITFIDSSYSDGVHPVKEWIWNYGDGITDTLTSSPFQHLFALPGLYSVTLKIVDSNGCMDSSLQTNNIIISKPVADFISSDTLSCHSNKVSFNNLSTGPALTFNWNFGDGITSTLSNPVHNYLTQGIFTVSLTITDKYGCTDKIVKTNYITVTDPKAAFIMSDSVSTCPPLVVTFTNKSNGFISRSWDFGDGTTSSLDNPTHFYSIPGIYNVVLTVTGYNGCTDAATKEIVVRGPQGSFTYTNIRGCNPLQTDFVATTKDNVTFIWDFNDGTTISTPDSVISHTYTNLGTYLPKMILVDAHGCQVPISGIDTIRVFGVKADFVISTTTLCDSGFVTFTDKSSSNDVITKYLWSFGDGSTSALKNPVHSYNANGFYQPKLKVTTNEGCTDTISNPAPIKLISGPKISITANSGVCVPATINFSGQLLKTDSSAITWRWSFANGNFSSLQNPRSQVYTFAGTYNIQLVATNSSGCKDSAIKTVIAYPLPVIKANAGAWLCKGQSVNLSVTGGASYSWSPAINLSCTNCATPVAKPDSSIKYFVQGTSVNGCIAFDSVNILVKVPFKMKVGIGDTLCKGRSAQLFASGTDNYLWSPASGVNNPAIANPIVTPSVTTTFMVIGSDDKGCFKDTGYVPVTVYPIPTVDAGADKTINIGQTADLDPILSPDVTTSIWTPTSGIFRNRFPGITVKPSQTTEYTVDVMNAGGCKARDRVTIYVLCNNANVFIPNTFSPNGDGANDIFYPRGTGLFNIRSFRIFNRWGEVVFEKSNFKANDETSGWNGTYKGKKLDPDVFVYTIDIVCENNTLLTYKGNIALIQ